VKAILLKHCSKSMLTDGSGPICFLENCRAVQPSPRASQILYVPDDDPFHLATLSTCNKQGILIIWHVQVWSLCAIRTSYVNGVESFYYFGYFLSRTFLVVKVLVKKRIDICDRVCCNVCVIFPSEGCAGKMKGNLKQLVKIGLGFIILC
jgi:hypothetical protein